MRKVTKLGLVLAVSLTILAGLIPAHAAASGNGGVTGTVTSSPGITLNGHPDSFHFTPILLSGTFNDGSNPPFSGEITTSDVYGRTTGNEDTTNGNGVVDPFTFHDTVTVDGSKLSGTCGGTTPGSAGTFTRIITAVEVTLHCKISIGGKPFVPANVTVVAQFTPTSGDGVTTAVTAANFSGEYILN